jgi:c-di-GMP-binding flagellar brake protein YcgR
MVLLLLFAIPILGFLLFMISRLWQDGFGSWWQFHVKGKEAGFSAREIGLLRDLAVKANVPEPVSIFYSRANIDLCIRSLVRTIRLSGEEDPVQVEFLSKLYEYRKKIEIDNLTNNKGISSSRQINNGQFLRVLVNDSGLFKSRLIKNTNQHLIISRPFNPTVPITFAWKGLQLSIYLWHVNDAGYVFDCQALDETFIDGAACLIVSHSDALFRTQKRNSVRVRTHKSAFLYAIQDEAAKSRFEVVPGVKCFIEDLSDTGCAVTLGGKVELGMRVKVQFVLDNIPLGMSGTVRSVEYKEETNRSLLHIEADPLSQETRNYILGEVFGMLSGDDDFVPFRLQEEEIKTMES